MKPPREYECLGGPICGRRVAKTKNMSNFVCHDDQLVPHYYRLIRVVNDARTEGITFYHYFGSNRETAHKKHPTLVPPREKFKPIRRKK